MNRFWTRIFIIGAGLLLLLFFSNDFGIVDIQNTAVVVALGIDRSQEDETKHDVTAQIAIPTASGSSGADAACQITIKNVSTIGEAVSQINSRTGWYPTLVYCNLILFCTNTATQDVFSVLDYFLRSDYVPDTALVVLADGHCGDFLGSQSPINDMSSSAITKTLSSAAQKSGLVSVTNLRDFSKAYYSPAKSGFLPMIELKPASEEKPPAQEEGEQAFAPVFADSYGNISRAAAENASVPAANFHIPRANGFENVLARLKHLKFRWWRFKPSPLPVFAAEQEQSSGSDPTGGTSQPNTKVFQASKTGLFHNGVHVGTLDEDETLALNLATADTDLATLQVTVNEDGKDTVYTLSVRAKKKKRKLTVQDDLAKFSVTVECSAQITDASRAKSIEDITRSQIVGKNVLQAAEKHLQSKLASAFDKSVACNSDIFGVQQHLYRHNYKHYESMKDTILQQAHPVFSVRFVSDK